MKECDWRTWEARLRRRSAEKVSRAVGTKGSVYGNRTSTVSGRPGIASWASDLVRQAL